MTSAERQMSDEFEIAPEESLRAALYRLLSRYLTTPPTEQTLKNAANLSGDATPLGTAIATFARIAARSDLTTVRREYEDLFIGLGRGELIPYASYYLTGFLQEKPLARLRQDMARLGVSRATNGSDPEDHAASVLEIMAGLIDGAFGTPLTIADQKAFHDAHLASWLPIFFRDLEAAQSSVFFAALGGVGRVFLKIEDAAFAID